jgi:hypothetical protein
MQETTEFAILELPDWMRQARRRLDLALFIVIGLGMIAAWPFIRSPQLPRTNDTEHYVFRGTDTAQAIQEGFLYPRWSANALGGYGAPIPNYTPTGAAYAVGVLETILTDDPLAAVRILYAGSLIMAGLAVYALCLAPLGAASAILAAALYVFSPPVALVAPHLRGDLPAVIASALLPLLLWSSNRMRTVDHPFDLFVVSITTAALGFTAPAHLLVGVTLVIVTSLWQQTSAGKRFQLLAVILLGVCVAGCFWLPALLEQNAIQWIPTLMPAPLLNIGLLDLLRPLQPVDPQALLPTLQMPVGWLQLGFALLGSIGLFRRRALKRWCIPFAVSLLPLTAALLVFPQQFGLSSALCLCLAVIAGCALRLRDTLPRRTRRLLLPTLLILIWIGSNPIWLLPVTDDVFGSTNAAAQVQYEQQGYGIAALPAGQPVPVSLRWPQSFNRTLIEGYQSGNVNKIAPGQITSSTQIGLLTHESQQDRFQVRRVLAPVSLNLLTAYFPGWVGQMDNRTITLRPNLETGLIQIDIPTTLESRELVVGLRNTPEQNAGWAITALSVLGLGLLLALEMRRSRPHPPEIALLSASEIRLNGLVLLIISAATLLVSFTPLNTALTARPGYGLDGSVRLPNRTEAGLSLIAYSLDRNLLRRGDSLNLVLFWQAQRVITSNLQIRLRLTDNQSGTHWLTTDFRHPGYYPTSRWNSSQYVRDPYQITLPDDLPNSNYQINLEVVTCTPTCIDGVPVTFFDGTGQPIGARLSLPTLIRIEG